MTLNNLMAIKTRTKKRVGRGESSGKGKTSARGMKGQKARGKLPLSFEGGQLPIVKRLPFQRGIGNRPAKEKLALSLSQLAAFKEGEEVNIKTLIAKGIITEADKNKKIKLVDGKLDKALKVALPASATAKKAIEKAKGNLANV